MPTIKQAQVPPANVKDMVPVSPVSQSAPPSQQSTGLDERAIAPVPGILTTSYDRIRQWIRPGTAQYRTFPLPPRANSQVNAATNSAVAAAAAATPNIIAPGLVFKGTWQSFAKYGVNDVVIFNKSAYLAVQASLGIQPDGDDDPPQWQLLSENLLFNVSPPALVPVLVQHGANQTRSGLTVSVTLAKPVTKGNTIIVTASLAPSQDLWPITVTDGVNTYSLDMDNDGASGNLKVQFWHTVATTTSSLTITASEC